ncbi:hypothetical protein [Solitalea canadensis]|uniref:Uncharacterized protein n=1 Tax=Solitalea canadensis (strain ATCC 29591 / DSM 3403 / JCM 21819 / LMG 8368 / NBRC 15130 / NCIMB 12057 / USAM 9D) TaxID=929556 RepID=H8KPC4_SOLCM|nr:hypothetical protein [Solitalea canadensis]AFD05822.1 hypothetical protein Solca_0697 [Solitalea canadensis DSM 3403]
MITRSFFIVLFFLIPGCLFAQYNDGVVLELGAGSRANLGGKWGGFRGYTIPVAVNFIGSTGWYGGVLFQGGKMKTTPSKFSNKVSEQFDQWLLGAQAGKLIPLNTFLSADINIGLSLLYTDGVAFANDIASLFDKNEEFINNENAFDNAHINGSSSLSFLFLPHKQSPVYFKAGGYVNLNSFATSKGLLFSIGLRL